MAEIRGVSIIAGQPAATGSDTFSGFDPTKGKALAKGYHAASDGDIDRACETAAEAFETLRAVDRPAIAAGLDAAASNIHGLGKRLVEVCSAETGLTSTRVISERERTTGVLRMFAGIVREGLWVRACVEPGDHLRRPNPRPDLRRMLRPLGPVAVFGVSNFPLAYSTAGGDTASSLAAGCPVVVKGHPMHPGTGELVAAAVAEGIAGAGLPPGSFSFLHAGGKREHAIGARLVNHPGIRAVGFTGSFGGGTALEKIARERADPIPVFAEMGSVNPVFLLSHALETKAKQIAERLEASVTNAAGQMCTCPGLIFVVRGPHADAFERALADRFNASEPGVMLGPRILRGFVEGLDSVRSIAGVDVRGGSVATVHTDGPVKASPVLLRTTGPTFLAEPGLHEEVFGPSTMLVVCNDEDELLACARAIRGSLTGTIWAGPYDGALLAALEPILVQRVGRLVFNGVPTGVEVNAAMVHGGPFPATTAPHTTAQGVMAMERWCRPVCYQNAPAEALPHPLRDRKPGGAPPGASS